jgi:glucan phosphoethanolaminetransferase (alkaline phosphatase superfamily)
MEVLLLQNRKDSVLRGLIPAVSAWTVYAVVECFFSSILPWGLKTKLAYIPVHHGFTAMLFVLYPLVGLSLGALSALLLRASAARVQFLSGIKSELLLPAVATSTVVMAFSINFAAYSTTRSPADVFSLMVSVVLVAALILSALSQGWAKRLLFLTNPWTTCMTLVGSSWLTKTYLLPERSLAIKAGTISAYIVTIILISILVRKSFAGQRTQTSTVTALASSIKYFRFPGLAALLVLGMSFALDEQTQVVDSGSKSVSGDANLPNVLLITMDTVRQDHLSLYGYERDTTPHLKKFSEDATLFTNAVSSGSMTLTAHASIFTGLYARQHGAHHDPPAYPRGRPLDDKFLTLAEILAARGYQTMGVAANLGYLGTAFGLQRGFQYYDNRRPVPFLGVVQGYFIRRGIRDFMTRFAASSDFDRRTRRAEELNEETFKLLDQVKSNDRPFFLFINYMDAHWPYLPPPPYDTLYPGKDENFTLEHYFELMEKVLKQERKIRVEEHRHLISQYDGGIAYLDFHIGHLIDQLRNWACTRTR